MFDKEFLTGVGITEEQIEKVMKEYESDVTGLKVKRDEFRTEYEKYKGNLDKFTTERENEKTGFQKRIEELEKQVKASGSEELKSYYEAEIKKTQGMYAAQLDEATKKAASLETGKNELYSEYVKVLRDIEFEKAAEKINNVDPAKKAMLRDLFFARNQFDFTTVDDTRKFLSKDGNYKNVNDTLQSFISTDEGKFFLLSNSTGGGATGSTGSKPPIGNPFIKGKENLDEQARILKENPALAALLKAQAAALAKQ